MRTAIHRRASCNCQRRMRQVKRTHATPLNLVGDYLVTGQSAQLRNMRARRARFLGTAHFFKDLGKQNVLPWLVRLTRDGTLLYSKGVIESILPQSHER